MIVVLFKAFDCIIDRIKTLNIQRENIFFRHYDGKVSVGMEKEILSTRNIGDGTKTSMQ
jgi:hypothetical protein